MFSRAITLSVLVFVAGAFAPAHQAHAFLGNLMNKMETVAGESRLRDFQSVADQDLVGHFYKISDDGKTYGLQDAIPADKFRYVGMTEGTFSLHRAYFRASNLGELAAAMREFADSPLDDEVGVRYVEFAQSRGNVVKMYKPALGLQLNRMFDHKFTITHPANNVINFLGAENVLIEFTPDGDMVSVMLRAHQGTHSINVRSFQHTTFVFGQRNMRLIENRVANKVFEDTLLREIKPVKKVAESQ